MVYSAELEVIVWGELFFHCNTSEYKILFKPGCSF